MASVTSTLAATQQSSLELRKPERLVSLDVYRGLTIAGMILVTDPGNYDHCYWPLLHAKWNGWTPTDMIFPSFLFIVGVAITLAFHSRKARGETRRRLARHVLVRAALLILFGLLVNRLEADSLSTLRFPGILQRIALCYAGGALLYLAIARWPDTGKRMAVIGATSLALVVGYWAILVWVPTPGFGPRRLDSLGYLGGYIDRAIFTTPHMWAYGTTPGYGVTYDPEGLLSTLGALVNLLLGILAGEWLRTNRSGSRKAWAFALAGAALFAAGLGLHPLLPINKRMWTSTFVLLSGGFSLMAFALCYWLVDLRRSRWWTAPVLVFGTNAILAFVLSSVITKLTTVPFVGSNSLRQLGYNLFLPYVTPVNASLAFAILIVAINVILVYPLYRKRIFLRV